MKFNNLTGKRFGRLFVIARAENSISGYARWNCLCDCGKHTVVHGKNLTKGRTGSCGCMRNEMISKRRTANLIGNKFGRLTVVSFLRKDRRPFWKCKCACGKIVVKTTSELNLGKTKSCGCYNKDRIRETQIVNLTGMVFGKLTVISLDESKRGKGAYWICQCECGNECSVFRKHLLAEYTASCGCARESNIAREVKKHFKEFGAIPEYKIIKNNKTGRWLPFDLYIPDGIFVEIHGIQHYEFIKYYHKSQEYFEYKKSLDSIKRSYAESNGIYIEVDLRKINSTEQAIEHIYNSLVE